MPLKPNVFLRDQRELQQDDPQSGVVLLQSLTLSQNGGSGWTASSINIDAPSDATFARYRRIRFQFSALGSTSSTASSLFAAFRRNGGSFSVARFYQAWGVTAASSSVYVNSSAAGISPNALTGNSQITDTQYIRQIVIEIDQFGYDSQMSIGSNTTLASGGMNSGTGSFALPSTGVPPYTESDYCGITLTLSSASFTPPKYTTIITSSPVVCDIYGYPIK